MDENIKEWWISPELVSLPRFLKEWVHQGAIQGDIKEPLKYRRRQLTRIRSEFIIQR